MRLVPGGVTPRNGKQRPARARFCLAVASGLAVLAAAGCSASGGPGGNVSATITIAAIPGVDNAPLYLAVHDGLFAAAGLTKVRILPETSATAEFAALSDNQAQIASADYGDIFYYQSHPPKPGGFKILADGYDATTGSLEVLTLPGSAITNPADLATARVGAPNYDILPNQHGPAISLETLAATQVLSDYTPAASSVNWQPMSQQAEVNDLVHHRIQAILVSEPYIFEAESEAGAVEVLDAASGFTAQWPLSGYVSTSGWVKDNSAAIADFQSAMAQAQSRASISGSVQKALHAYTGITTEVADLSTIGSYPTSTSAGELNRVDQLMWESGMIPRQANVSQMIVP